jgi:DeoR family glycerol-3-phosphate regulon repressor
MKKEIPEKRKSSILSIVNGSGQASISDLADRLGISHETVRRDLTALEERGLLRKVHGGAARLQVGLEAEFSRRLNQNRDGKQMIARAAAGCFQPGDSLFIDAGTTTALFAEELAHVPGLTVITNSVEVAMRLWTQRPNRPDIHILGGRYEGDVSEVLGPIAIDQIGQFRADYAVLTVGAIDESGGVMDFNTDEASIARAMIRNARNLVVLADHSKLDRTALVHVCALKVVTTLITDLPLPEPLAVAFASAGVKVVVASLPAPTRADPDLDG